jgi:hypothetical protein
MVNRIQNFKELDAKDKMLENLHNFDKLRRYKDFESSNFIPISYNLMF